MAAAAVQVRSHDGWGRSLCIVDTPAERDMQGRSSTPHTDFVFSFKRLNIAAELLHVPSIKMKFKGLYSFVMVVLHSGSAEIS